MQSPAGPDTSAGRVRFPAPGQPCVVQQQTSPARAVITPLNSFEPSSRIRPALATAAFQCLVFCLVLFVVRLNVLTGVYFSGSSMAASADSIARPCLHNRPLYQFHPSCVCVTLEVSAASLGCSV